MIHLLVHIGGVIFWMVVIMVLGALTWIMIEPDKSE